MKFNISATLGDLGSIRVVRGDVHDATVPDARHGCLMAATVEIDRAIQPITVHAPLPALFSRFAEWGITE